jgi:hypothetical protein
MKFYSLLVLTQLSALAAAGIGNQENNQLNQAQEQPKVEQMMGANNYPPRTHYPPSKPTTKPTAKPTTKPTKTVSPPHPTTPATPTTPTTPPLTPEECNKNPALIQLCVIAGILKPNPAVCGGASDKTLIDICIVAGILAPTPAACNNKPSAALINICINAGILPGTKPSIE